MKVNVLWFKRDLRLNDHLPLKRAIEQGEIQLGLIVPKNEAELARTKKTISLTWLFDASEVGRQERAESYMNYISDKAESARLEELGVDAEKLHPLVPVFQNCASDKKMIGHCMKLHKSFGLWTILLIVPPKRLLPVCKLTSCQTWKKNTWQPLYL